jgi:predicted TIM-barrel fold metal-dependent hydrolase
MYKVGEEEGLSLAIQEMDEAGVTYVVTPGRQVSGVSLAAAGDGPINFNVPDEDLVALRKRFDNRLFGLTALDLNKPVDELVSQIKKAITVHGLSGVVMEPGYYKDENGAQLWADNPKLFPIYETIIELDTFIMHQSGIYAGEDFGVNYWPPVDRLLQKFPKLKFLLAHAGYPDIFGALALAAKHQNYFISPDIYCFFPAGENYINSITKLQDQFIWATAYPMAALMESVVGTLEYAATASLTPAVMEKYMYGNAARLLKITS